MTRRTFFRERSMRFTVIGIGMVVAALFAKAAPATAQSASKLAYVDTRKILEQMPGYAQAESTYKKEVATYQEEVRKLRASIDSSAADLERQAPMLDATKRAAKQKALEEQGQRAQQRFQDIQESMAKRESELIEPMRTRMMAV